MVSPTNRLSVSASPGNTCEFAHLCPRPTDPRCTADLNEYKSQLLARISEESSGVFEDDGEAVIETDDDDDARDSPAHRTNFASSSLGASVMSANPEMTGPKSLLVGDADAYALSRCDAKKFVVIQLSEDVLVDELVISNEERYSSAVRELRATGSLKYPATEWVVLGNFTAANKLGEQRFPVTAKSFVRFLKLTWLSHYGAEFYCTWTRVQVRGGDAAADPRKGHSSLHRPSCSHFFFLQVFGSTLIEDLQTNMYTTDAEVQTMKQQLSAAHAAVHQQSAMAAGVTTTRVQAIEDGPSESSNVASALPAPCASPCQSSVGASGPVSVAIHVWSLSGVCAGDHWQGQPGAPLIDGSPHSTPADIRPQNASGLETSATTMDASNATSPQAHATIVDVAPPITPLSKVSPTMVSAPTEALPASASPLASAPSASASLQTSQSCASLAPVPSTSSAPGTAATADAAVSREPISPARDVETRPASMSTATSPESTEAGAASALKAADNDSQHDASSGVADATSSAESMSGAGSTEAESPMSNFSSEADGSDDGESDSSTSPGTSAGFDVLDGDSELEEIARFLNASRETLQSIMLSAPGTASSGASDDVSLSPASSGFAVSDADAANSSANESHADSGSDEAPAADATALTTELGASGATGSGGVPPLSSSPLPQQQPVTVFKQLTRKLKELEIDQSVMSSYLSDLRTSYSSSIAGLQLAVDGLRAAAEQGERAKSTKLDTLAHAVFEMREALALLYHRHVSLLRRMHTLEGGVDGLDTSQQPGDDGAEEELAEEGADEEEEEEEAAEDEGGSEEESRAPEGDCGSASGEGGSGSQSGDLQCACPDGSACGAGLRRDPADSSAVRSGPKATAPPPSSRCVSRTSSDPRRAFYASELRTVEEMREVFEEADSSAEESGGGCEEAGVPECSSPRGQPSRGAAAAAPAAAVTTVFYPTGRAMSAFLDDTQQLIVGWVTGIAVGRGGRPAGGAAPPAIPVPLPVPVPVPVAVHPRSGARHRGRGRDRPAAPSAPADADAADDDEEGDDAGGELPAMRRRLQELERRLVDSATSEERLLAAAATAERALTLSGLAAVACCALALASCCAQRVSSRDRGGRRADA